MASGVARELRAQLRTGHDALKRVYAIQCQPGVVDHGINARGLLVDALTIGSLQTTLDPVKIRLWLRDDNAELLATLLRRIQEDITTMESAEMEDCARVTRFKIVDVSVSDYVGTGANGESLACLMRLFQLGVHIPDLPAIRVTELTPATQQRVMIDVTALQAAYLEDAPVGPQSAYTFWKWAGPMWWSTPIILNPNRSVPLMGFYVR